MKKYWCLLFLLASLSIVSQITITGTVRESNTPLEGVAVYLNNTMIGTTTSKNGAFSLNVKEGQYNLIVSYLGFKKINFSLNTATYTTPLEFVLEEDETMLDEVVIAKTKYDEEWKYNLSAFKKAFIGQTKLAEGCEILNPKVLHFDFDAKNNKLTAMARKPIVLKNKSLGYKITFELAKFTLQKNSVTYLGYSRYENLKGGKRKHRQWKENRLRAYHGSFMHFYQSLQKGTTYKEGFIIHQFKRVANPERPSETAIKNARDLIRLSNATIDFSKQIKEPKNELEAASLIVNKARLPKFKDYVYKSNVPIKDIVSKKEEGYYLTFENNLSVVYTKEKEEKGYILRNAFSTLRAPLPQTSSVIGLQLPTQLAINGVLTDPLAVFYEGYWSYEKFADTLPLDYIP